MRITMDAEGRLVIPREIRTEAGLEPDVPLEIRVRGGMVEIARALDRASDVTAAAGAAGESPARRPSLSLVKGAAQDDGGRGDQRGGAAATAAAAVGREHPQLDLLIRMAIAHRRLVELVYDNRKKLVEPHDYGLRSGEPHVFVWQQSGESRSGPSDGWRSLRLASISDFRVLEETFAGPREADRHIEWDRLFASVSR